MKKLMLFLYMFVPIVPAIAQEAQRSSEISVSEDGLTSQSVRDLASQLAGNWICYRNGGYDIKRITATREVYERYWYDGSPRGVQSTEIEFSVRGRVLFFSKKSQTDRTVYEGIYKLHEGKLYEFNRGILASTAGAPKVDAFERLESPMQKWLAAARRGDLTTLGSILQEGGDLQASYGGVPNALAFAAAAGQIDAIKFLVSKGADVSRKSGWYGTLPLVEAARFGKTEACGLLLELDADLQGTHNFGMSPLHETAFHGRIETARFLIEKGAHLNATNNNGGTPLHVAAKRAVNGNGTVRRNQVAVAKLLLTSGANSDLKNNQGETALDIARARNITPLIDVLQK